MPATPNITLTATLDDLTGAAAGSTANPAKLRITLCSFGPSLPLIQGTAMLAKTGPFSVYSAGAAISTLIWGNDQISPSGTYYSIEILDGEDNVVQCGAYELTGTGSQDLSNLAQIIPPYGFPLAALTYLPCALGANNHSFTAPGLVIAPAYNGVLLPEGQSLPTLSYTLDSTGTRITLNFDIDPSWERIDAFCVV
jgi:hypothetical protein